MHHLIDKKRKIYFYIFLLFFLSSIFNFEIKKFLDQIFLIKNIEYENQKLDIKMNQLLNKNILNLNKKEIVSSIDNYPILGSFKINKIYPSTLKVNFVETNPIVKIYINDELYYIGKNEKLFKKQSENIDVPLIKGFVELDKVNQFLKILNKSSLKLNNMEYLVYHMSNRWDIYFKDNIILKLPIELNLNLLEKAKIIIEESSLKEEIIDLRIEGKLILSNE